MRSTSRVYINHELPTHMREYSVWTELRFTSTPDPRWFNRYWCLHFSTAPCATAKAVVCCIGNVSYVLPTMHVLVGISAQNKCFPHGLRFTASPERMRPWSRPSLPERDSPYSAEIVCLTIDSLLMSRATLSRRSPRPRLAERKRINIWRNITSSSACYMLI